MDSGYGSPRRGGRVEITVYREPLTFVLNERRGRKKVGRYHMHTPTCSHTYEPNVGSQGGLGCEHLTGRRMSVPHVHGLAAVRGPGMETN